MMPYLFEVVLLKIGRSPGLYSMEK